MSLLLHDKETLKEKRARLKESQRADEAFRKAHNAQASYGAALRQYARQIAHIVAYYGEGDPPMVPMHKMPAMFKALRDYREGTTTWAHATAARMLAEVNRRNLSAWRIHGKEMSIHLKRLLATAPISEAIAALLAEQVKLITSLPLEAAERVQEASGEALLTSARYPEREADIEEALEAAHPMASEAWLRNRATLIARTETARSASVLVEVRAKHIGSTTYIWKTAGDARVRESHRKLNNHEYAWDDPPLSDPPDYHAHPGQIWNCRCVALPVISE